MAKFVRVRDQRTGHEYTVTAEKADLDKAVLTVLEEPAVDDRNRPLLPRTKPAPKSQPVIVTEPAKTTTKKEN